MKTKSTKNSKFDSSNNQGFDVFISRRFLCFVAVSVLAIGLSACAKGIQQSLPDESSSEPAPQASNQGVNPNPPPAMDDAQPVNDQNTNLILRKYSFIDPQNLIADKMLAQALLYYDQNYNRIKNKNYLTVIDFSKNSSQKRFFIIDMNSGKIWALHVAHGKGSDPDGDGLANIFSNKSGSEASSLGFYLTAETYTGNHGRSLKVDGLSATNSNVRARSVVIHGADYVQEADVKQGRSWGCFALTMSLKDQVIDMIKGGSLMYAVK